MAATSEIHRTLNPKKNFSVNRLPEARSQPTAHKQPREVRWGWWLRRTAAMAPYQDAGPATAASPKPVVHCGSVQTSTAPWRTGCRGVGGHQTTSTRRVCGVRKLRRHQTGFKNEFKTD